MVSDQPLLEIRLLGPMVVLRRDRTEVDRAEWTTDQAGDLLRLLAVRAGRSVRTELLVDWLWPDLSPRRAAGSLRAAASRVRHVLRDDCIVRGADTLTLRHAWVDAVLVQGLLEAGRLDMQAGRAPEVVGRARSMENVYRGRFRAHDDRSAWALGIREYLASGRLALLEDAAQCCVALGAHREALVFANAVLAEDPTVEAVYRTKIRAHVELGEARTALRVFESYRQQLVDNLGLEPPTAMRRLHLELLRGQ